MKTPADPQEGHLGPELTALAMGETLENEAELRAHLNACSACQEELKDTMRALEAIDARPPPKLSADFDQAMFAKLDAIDAQAPSRAALAWARLRAWWWAPALGLATAAMALWFLRPPQLRPAPSQAGALELAQDLELYENLEVLEHLDVLDDLELIDQVVEG